MTSCARPRRCRGTWGVRWDAGGGGGTGGHATRVARGHSVWPSGWLPAAPPPRSCHPAARPGCPEGTEADRVAQPAPLGLPHAYPAPHGRDRAGAAGSGGTSPAGLAERVSASGEGDRDWDGDQNGDSDGDKDSPASSSVGAGRRRLVYRDGVAIPPARSAFRGSSAERKADVTPCFWVQTIGIQKQGAARLQEPAAPSSARPAALRSAPAALGPQAPRRSEGARALSTGLAAP